MLFLHLCSPLQCVYWKDYSGQGSCQRTNIRRWGECPFTSAVVSIAVSSLNLFSPCDAGWRKDGSHHWQQQDLCPLWVLARNGKFRVAMCGSVCIHLLEGCQVGTENFSIEGSSCPTVFWGCHVGELGFKGEITTWWSLSSFYFVYSLLKTGEKYLKTSSEPPIQDMFWPLSYHISCYMAG